jgi:predicted aspartyl protease
MAMRIEWMRAAGLATMATLAGAQQPLASDVAAMVDPLTLPAAQALPAEIKPENFAYVAATRRDRVGRVMAPVFINDVGPFAFLVDTGASTSVIGPRVAARLNLTPRPERTKLLRGITGSERVPTVGIDSLTAGQIALGARELPMVEPRVFADADGIFGVDAFARGCLAVSFEKSRVSILDSRCPRADMPWETMRAELRFGGLAVVSGRIGSVKVAAIIDTGAERTLGNRALLEAAGLQKKLLDPDTATQVRAATTHVVPGNILKTPPFRMGGVYITNMTVVFGDFEVFEMWELTEEPAIVVGMDVLGTTQAMMIDFERQQLHVLPGRVSSLTPTKMRSPTRIPRD